MIFKIGKRDQGWNLKFYSLILFKRIGTIAFESVFDASFGTINFELLVY